MRNTIAGASLALLLVPALSLAQAKPAAAQRTRVAVLDLRAIGVEAAKAELLSEIALSEAAALPYLEVIGRSDIQAMLGFEKQRKMLGCEEDSACIAEIGGALGVKLVLVGSVGKLGNLYRLDLKVLDTKKAGAVRRFGQNVEGAEEKMVAAVQAAVRSLFAAEAAAAGVTAPAATPPAATPSVVAEPPAAPAGPSHRRWLFGLRVGYAQPNGDLNENLKQTDWVEPHGFFGLEGLYKLTPKLGIGASLTYGGASTGDQLKNACDLDAVTCEPGVVRLALDLNYDFTGPEAGFVPWIGAGIGFESLVVTINGGSGSISASGFEPFHGQLGLDFRVGKLRIGPVAMFSVAKYSTIEFKVGDSSQSQSMDGKTHSYGFFGLRGGLEL